MKRTYFGERPLERRVHFAWDQRGAKIGISERLFANTLCKMNSDVPESHITTNPDKVTCKICRRHARFRLMLNTQSTGRAGRPIPVVYDHTRMWTLPPAKSEEQPEFRHRRNWRGKLILQIRETVQANTGDPTYMSVAEFSETKDRWRDATMEDLKLGVV